MELNALAIFFRWLHVISACVMIGSIFFYSLLLPRGTEEMDPEPREMLYRRCRRGLKMSVHVPLLLFLISGISNTMRNWPSYTQRPGAMLGMFGMHVQLG